MLNKDKNNRINMFEILGNDWLFPKDVDASDSSLDINEEEVHINTTLED